MAATGVNADDLPDGGSAGEQTSLRLDVPWGAGALRILDDREAAYLRDVARVHGHIAAEILRLHHRTAQVRDCDVSRTKPSIVNLWW